MPAIAEQVATIEHDLQEALAKINSLTAERETLKKALAATTVEKSELEAKQDDMQSLVDETREMVDRLANMSLDMLRSSRRPIASPKEAAGYNAAEANHAAIESTGEAEAATQPQARFDRREYRLATGVAVRAVGDGRGSVARASSPGYGRSRCARNALAASYVARSHADVPPTDADCATGRAARQRLTGN